MYKKLSTEQLVNLIDMRTQKALEKYKKELENHPLPKKKNNCTLFKIVLYILKFIMLFLQTYHLLQ